MVIAGEITTTGSLDYPKIAREVIRDVGYTRAKYGFDCETCGVICSVDRQSPDIALGVDTGGAGDQGLMFGYACTETRELMPLPIMLAHALTRRLSESRRQGILNWLRPDGKSQVTVEYDGTKPVRVDTVVVSTQHSPDISYEDLWRRHTGTCHPGRGSRRAHGRRHDNPHQPHGAVRDGRGPRVTAG